MTLYLEHHLSELTPDDVNAAFGTNDASEISRARFLAAMLLQRVGLYPASPTRFAVLDYTLDGDVTQYVLCVTFDADRAVTGIDMES